MQKISWYKVGPETISLTIQWSYKLFICRPFNLLSGRSNTRPTYHQFNVYSKSCLVD